MPTDEYVAIPDLELHYLDWGGDGPPLVMLHGFTGHAHSWDRVAAALTDHYRIIALDQRGHGDSDWAPGYGSRPMVADLLAFLDALGLDRVTLMGLSMGGNVGYAFAAAHPDRVERLVVLDIGPELAPEGMQRITSSLADKDVFGSVDEAVAQARAANHRPSDADVRDRVSRNLRARPDGTYTYKWDKGLRDGTAGRDEHTEEERWAAWRSLRGPVLLVRGDSSDILSAETAARMIEDNPNVSLAVIEDCGHTITVDRPEALIQVVVPWLTG